MGLRFSVDIPDQELYSQIAKARTSIGKAGLGVQIGRFINQTLSDNTHKRRIASMLGANTVKPTNKPDNKYIEKTLEGITLFEIERTIKALGIKLSNSDSDFHKIAYDPYKGIHEPALEEMYATATDLSDTVTLFSKEKEYLRSPVGSYWDKKDSNDKYKILPYLYRMGFIGLSPYKLPRTPNSKAPKHFFLPKKI